MASTLLGVDPPALPAQLLVRSGELFGIADGTTRVAISRMLAAGELVADDGTYRLAGHLLDRQARQTASRSGATRAWDGTWELALVRDTGPRRAADRTALRRALTDLRLAELREGVWLRPANLGPDRSPDSRAIADEQCVIMRDAAPDHDVDATTLWDLDGWATDARALIDELRSLQPAVERGDLGEGFVASAAVLRHLQHDPLLPDQLLPRDWPGERLRTDYARYDTAFKRAWRAHFRTLVR